MNSILSKNNLNLILLILINLFSAVYLFSFLNLNYLSTISPDYQYYKDYFDYFFNVSQTTNREQGLLYFYIVSFFIKTGPNHHFSGFEDELISNAIQISNITIYLFGLLGLYFLLRTFNFSSNLILSTFAVINFLPPTINMILTMKPEVLAFTLLTWFLYFIEVFKKTNEFKFLYFSCFPLVLLATSKGTILGMVALIGLIIFLTDFKFFKDVRFALVVLFFLLISIPIIYENYIANLNFVFNHTPGDTNLDMNQTAEISFLYNINFRELYVSPFKNFHADSLMGIIGLDTFGDYFKWYAYNDESAFKYIKVNFDRIWIISYWRELFSLILSFLFYFLFLYFTFSSKKFKIYSSLPFYGLVILIVQSFGFPSKNFNKDTAELFKTHYLSFLLIISISFVLVLVFQNSYKIGLIVSFLIVSNTLFLYGTVFNNANNYDEYLNLKNPYTFMCSINQNLYKTIINKECFSDQTNNCELKNPIINFRLSNTNDYQPNLLLFKNYQLVDEDRFVVFVDNLEECNKYLRNDFELLSKYNKDLKNPLVNLLYFLILILFIIPYSLIRSNNLYK